MVGYINQLKNTYKEKYIPENNWPQFTPTKFTNLGYVIVFIMQSLNMVTRMCKMQTISRRAANLFCKDSIAGVIHPKVKLYI